MRQMLTLADTHTYTHLSVVQEAPNGNLSKWSLPEICGMGVRVCVIRIKEGFSQILQLLMAHIPLQGIQATGNLPP